MVVREYAEFKLSDTIRCLFKMLLLNGGAIVCTSIDADEEDEDRERKSVTDREWVTGSGDQPTTE